MLHPKQHYRNGEPNKRTQNHRHKIQLKRFVNRHTNQKSNDEALVAVSATQATQAKKRLRL
jgi:hypothetical protein